MAAKSAALAACCAANTIGRPGKSSWSFANATRLPAKEIGADQGGEEHRADVITRDVAARGRQTVKLGGGHERCGPAADAVEERHHLWDGRHLHEACRGDSDNGSDRHPRCDQPVLVDVPVEEREDDGDGHADRSDHVPGTGRGRSTQAANPDDQEDGRDEIGEVDRRLRQRERSRHLRLNISSMRSVTRKPPTTLTVAKTTAMNASTCSSLESADPGHEHGADENDPVDRVRPRHQRGVQHRRDLGDDLEADEDGEDEDGDAVEEAQTATGSFSTRPSWVTHVSRVISSSKSSVSRASSIRWSRKV